MSDYTPTTGAIRSGYAYYAPNRDVVEMALAFDRWLAEHDDTLIAHTVAACQVQINRMIEESREG